MIYWSKYSGHTPAIVGKKRKYDTTIYTLDIETSNYIVVDNKVIRGVDYLKLDEKERDKAIYQSNMYIWMLGINDKVYYGRTWDELKRFLKVLDDFIPEKKYFFIHNASFEFQYMRSVFHIKQVLSRKKRKIMTFDLLDYNITFKCSYMISNCALKELPKLFKLPVEKKVGDLDYDLLRNSKTELTEKELGYCEYDCLVVYYFILEEIKTYGDVKHVPTTSTGHVRRELMELVMKDYKYRRIVSRACNIDPVIFNRLQDAFMGGYTHANWLYTDEVIKNVDSYDETSAYPYILVTRKFPSSEFKKCNIKKREELSERLTYLLVVKFTNVSSKYWNSFISSSKCREIYGAKYDNGRIISADSFIMTITDIDFYLFLDAYNCDYEIIECYYATKSYLPKKFIEFVLDKYVLKTTYKDNEDLELEYVKEKNKFNALYGMSVTNEIRDEVSFDDEVKEWIEKELTNDEIKEKLEKQKKKGFLSFAYGVWVTAYARDILIRRIMELDEYLIYADTDSLKLKEGYNKKVIEDYNKTVIDRINYVSNALRIPLEKFAPSDIHGNKHMLGLFEYEGNGLNKTTYKKFITQGAKKYAYVRDEKDKNTKEIIKDKISITVAGVPKNGSKCLKKIEDFKDDLVFDYETTHKQMVMYNDHQIEVELTDYQGNKEIVKDKSGCCILPTTYVLGKSYDYVALLTDNSSKRARYKE